MAFLVCYSSSPPEDHTQKRAIYLDQQFYELILAHCRSGHGPNGVLREIVSLRYKSPVIVIAAERLGLLDQELAGLETSEHKHAQIADFRRVCARAEAVGCALTVSADMYPEL